jgi:hypothetical protein
MCMSGSVKGLCVESIAIFTVKFSLSIFNDHSNSIRANVRFIDVTEKQCTGGTLQNMTC